MKTFVMIHSHKYGTSVFTFQSMDDWSRKDNPDAKFPDENDLMKLSDLLGADVELDQDETVDIFEIVTNELPTI